MRQLNSPEWILGKWEHTVGTDIDEIVFFCYLLFNAVIHWDWGATCRKEQKRRGVYQTQLGQADMFVNDWLWLFWRNVVNLKEVASKGNGCYCIATN